jgi:hypothetical protein
MYLRIIRTTIERGQEAAYWAWSRDILDLWDAHGIVRAGGPYVTKSGDGYEVALWLTVHKDPESARSDFREMYATPRGMELIAQRPALVARTDASLHGDWVQRGEEPVPAPPVL